VCLVCATSASPQTGLTMARKNIHKPFAPPRGGRMIDGQAQHKYVIRDRLTQGMNLLLLAADIQEAILDSSNARRGKSTITERGTSEVSPGSSTGRIKGGG
jgi:hypothetical protein